MKKNIILVVLSIGVGYLLARFMFASYNVKNISVTSPDDDFYFTQLGVFSSIDNMKTNTTKLTNYIYLEDSDLYYVFGCITRNIDNQTKIEKYFTDNGYSVYRKEYHLNNTNLKTNIEKFDLLLSATDDSASIKELCRQGLEIYKEG